MFDILCNISHEAWIMTKRTRYQIKTVEMSLTQPERRGEKLVCRELRMEQQLICIRRVSWSSVGIWFECLLGVSFWTFFRHVPPGGDPEEDRNSWRDYISFSGLKTHWDSQGRAGQRDAWVFLLNLLPLLHKHPARHFKALTVDNIGRWSCIVWHICNRCSLHYSKQLDKDKFCSAMIR